MDLCNFFFIFGLFINALHRVIIFEYFFHFVAKSFTFDFHIHFFLVKYMYFVLKLNVWYSASLPKNIVQF